MHSLLNTNSYIFKYKQYDPLKYSLRYGDYDIYDFNTQKIILQSRELKPLTSFRKYSRFGGRNASGVMMSPFEIGLQTPEGEKVGSLKNNGTLFYTKLRVFDENDTAIGYIKQNFFQNTCFFTSGYNFKVVDTNGQNLFRTKYHLFTQSFDLLRNGVSLAQGKKDYPGILFSPTEWGGSDCTLNIDPSISKEDPLRLFFLFSVICINMV